MNAPACFIWTTLDHFAVVLLFLSQARNNHGQRLSSYFQLSEFQAFT